MKLHAIVAAAIFLTAFAVPASSQSQDAARAGAPASAPREPPWIRTATGEDVRKVYPALAGLFQLDGEAVVRCRVDKQGLLKDCEVTSETPRDTGFGAAALALTTKFQVATTFEAPGMAASPTEGAAVEIPLQFRNPLPSRIASGDVLVGLPAAERARLPLARRAMTADGVDEAIRGQAKAFLSILDRDPLPGVSPARAIADRALVQRIFDAEEANALDIAAWVYTKTWNDAELVARAEGRGGPADVKSNRALNDAEGLGFSRMLFRIPVAVGEFCATRDCPPRLPPTSATSSPPPPGPR